MSPQCAIIQPQQLPTDGHLKRLYAHFSLPPAKHIISHVNALIMYL